MSGEPSSVVVVGAGIAGLRTATALRDRGFEGRLVLIGNEPHAPYDRPPLSKEVLTGRLAPEATALPVPADVEVRSGRAAVRLDRAARRVLLDDGSEQSYEGLVIATGATAVPWPGPTPAQGVLTLRGLDDAARLRAALAEGDPLLVIGGGFLGCEIASAAREAGAPVALVCRDRLPMRRTVGAEVGALVARLQAEAGVVLRTGVRVTGFSGARRVTGVELSDGTRIRARTVVSALGARPATDWTRGSGLGTHSGGLRCDHRRRALDEEGRPVEGIVVVGDAAAAPHPLPYPGAPSHLVIGHWSGAVDHADTAASTLVGGPPPGPVPPPSFWSDQYGVRVRAVGLPGAADRVEVHEYDPERRRVEVSQHRGGRTVGAVTVNRTSRLAAHRARIVAEHGEGVVTG
ncbi:NAD(P)/FAD-dependent oxidoreductase [Nocardiopsis lambiniae]|uniref:FAD-dependent oxidoreductase n=1 Tax=Nocardiopsis lambiniae TaxID=3075539 RepID=A0ABU2MBE1_9ACTN|nr:FAD-dependent oxidoreductase [Nocardiopsis sp. DSM 44743]MDT0329893.1 FAD-dependent oxidoreductase [Nocardiopsis sp. DSM 44743]